MNTNLLELIIAVSVEGVHHVCPNLYISLTQAL